MVKGDGKLCIWRAEERAHINRFAHNHIDRRVIGNGPVTRSQKKMRFLMFSP